MRRAGAGRYWLIWVAVVPVAVWAAVRGFGLERGFPLVALISYTPYVAAVALLVAGVALALRNWPAAAVAGLATLVLAVAVLPRAVGAPEQAPANSVELRVLSANVLRGAADDEVLVDLVRRYRPHLLSVQELTPSFARGLRRSGIGRLLPEAELKMATDVSSSGLYARLPLSPLPERVIEEGFRMPRGLLRLPGGGAVRVVGVHPYPPMAGKVDEWSAALRSLPASGDGVPWVLAGDFNATLDHALMRDVLARGYRDAGAVVGEGLEPTWPSAKRRLLPVTIDHVLADRRIRVTGYAVEDLPGSDHRVVFARLAVPAAPRIGD